MEQGGDDNTEGNPEEGTEDRDPPTTDDRFPSDETNVDDRTDDTEAETDSTDADAGRSASDVERKSADGPNSARSEGADGWVGRLRGSDHGAVVLARELAISVAIVALIGLLLFGISGVWPPMVAIESGSMTPNMHQGDLVFIMTNDRLAPDSAHGNTGVVTAEDGQAADYRQFGDYGDVIVFKPNGQDSTPIIHRTMLWVDEGEDWFDRADPRLLHGTYEDCDDLPNCPAPHSGFITHGDDNAHYDQANPYHSPVKPEWVIGTAELRIPYLGWIRLGWASIVEGQSLTIHGGGELLADTDETVAANVVATPDELAESETAIGPDEAVPRSTTPSPDSPSDPNATASGTSAAAVA